MPFVENMDEEEKDPNASTGPISPVGGGGAVHLAPSSAVAPTGGNVASAGGAPTNTAGGQFASLNQYVTANQEQAVPLATTITAPITKQYSDLDAQNNATIAGLNSQVTGGYTPNNPDTLASESANPVSFASDAGNVKNFQSLLNDTYSGPASAEGTSGFTNQQTAINNAIAAGQQQTGTEAGRKQLLQSQEAVPTSGVTALDSAILSQSPEALSKVETAYQPFSSLLTNLNTGAQGVDTSIAKGQTDSAAAAKAANDAIAQQTAALNTKLTGDLSTAQTNIGGFNKDVTTIQGAANGYNSAIQAFLQANPQIKNPTAADLSQWLNLQTYAGSPTISQVATPEDYSTAAALQTLNGTNPVGTNINASTSSQAGTALPLNYQSIMDALNNGTVTASMTSEVKGLGDQITQAMAPFQAAQANADGGRGDWMKITGDNSPNIYQAVTPQNHPILYDANGNKVPATITKTVPNPNPGRGAPSTIQQTVPNPAWQALQKQTVAAVQRAEAGDAAKPGAAQGIQWVPQAATAYNALLTKLQAALSPVSSIQLPTQQTSSGSNALGDVEKGALAANPLVTGPIDIATRLGNSVADSKNPLLNAAALANPITTLSTLMIPQGVLNSIGNGIKSVLNDIGDLFGGLF